MLYQVEDKFSGNINKTINRIIDYFSFIDLIAQKTGFISTKIEITLLMPVIMISESFRLMTVRLLEDLPAFSGIKYSGRKVKNVSFSATFGIFYVF